jgi:peptidyl-prolyl cis-trans isomerase A (cyclophilin A)
MKHLNLLFLSTAALLGACGGGGGGAAVELLPPPPPPATLAPQVTLTVSNGAAVSGNLVITLTPEQTPVTVANFLAYVRSGFFNGTVIHRNSPGFVLQGGGYAGPMVAGGTVPALKPNNAAIVLEDATSLPNLRWTVAMARTGVADSATSQFFINLADNNFLNRNNAVTPATRGYAVFGTVTAGTDLVTAMAGAPCTAWPALLGNGECLPSPNLTITSAIQTR